MIKYNYIVRTIYDDGDLGEADIHKAETLEDAYNFMCKYYLDVDQEEEIKSQADFYKKYPFEKVKKSIEEEGYFVFWLTVLDIQTIDFYINNFIDEVY